MQRGFVLFTTLIIVFLVSAMTLSALNVGLLELRMSRAVSRADQYDYVATAGIDAGIKTILRYDQSKPKPICWLQASMDPVLYSLNRSDWLTQPSCSGQLAHIPYHYVIVPLSLQTACLQYYQVISYLPDMPQRWQTAMILFFDQEGLKENQCQVAAEEADLAAQLSEPVLLLSWYGEP